MNALRKITLALLVTIATLTAVADDNLEVLRPVTSAYTLEVGGARLVDTYLSPVRYKGWHLGLGYERWQAMRHAPERLVMTLRGNLGFDRTQNVVGNSTMLGLNLELGWAMYYKFRPAESLTIGVGGGPELNVGGLYNSRNGNNPVSAKGALTIDASAYAAWNFNLGRLPVTLVYTPSLPLVGAFFSPQYGELYYEMYLGDRSGLVHFAWPGNRFNLDNRLTADLHFGATSLRVGYRLGVFGSYVNNLTTRQLTQSFIVGVSGEWLSLNPRRPLSQKTKTISALW